MPLQGEWASAAGGQPQVGQFGAALFVPGAKVSAQCPGGLRAEPYPPVFGALAVECTVSKFMSRSAIIRLPISDRRAPVSASNRRVEPGEQRG
jgi:hypothetical protein